MRSTSALHSTEERRDELRLRAGQWLRDKRELAGLSQRELAERDGAVYYTFVSQIESGKGRLPAERYESWAVALGVDPCEFCKKMLSFYEPVTYRLLFGE